MRSYCIALMVICALSPASAATFTPPPHSRDVELLTAAAHGQAARGDWKGALTTLQEAQKVKGRNAYDDYLINDLLGVVELSLKDDAAAAAALDAAADAPVVPDFAKSSAVNGAIHMAYIQKDYDKLFRYGQIAAANNYLCCKNSLWLAVGYLDQKNFEKAAQFAQLEIISAKVENHPADKMAWQALYISRFNLHDLTGAREALSVLVNDYNLVEYAASLKKLDTIIAGQGPQGNSPPIP